MGKHVVVVGGGVAGLTAAHELLVRGFRVTLVERRGTGEFGGRARSFQHALRDREGKEQGLVGPVEHGFRFFPGFYRNLDHTMSRIRLADSRGAGTVLDNLVNIDEEWLSVSGKRIIQVPAAGLGRAHPTRRLMELLRLPKQLQDVGLTREDLEIYSDRIYQFATSSTIRRDVEYERMGWRDYVVSLDRSHEYYWYLASGLTRTLVAAKASKASTKTMGNTALRLMACYLDRERTSDRVLNGPTNDAWFKPWLAHLFRLGNERFEYLPNTMAHQVIVKDDQVVAIEVRGPAGAKALGADHAILALSAPALRDLVARSPELAGGFGAQAREGLETLVASALESMHGLQIFSRRRLTLNRGHQIFLDSHWGLTSLGQGNFWRPGQLPDGVEDILSIDISSWDLPGEELVKTARDASPPEIFREVMHQLSAALGSDFLTEEDVAGWYLDEGVSDAGERVMVNNVGSWALRPSVARTDVDGRETRGGPANLYLAGDWIRSKTDLACMEGANETARRAVNEVLRATKSQEQPCQIFDPEDLEPEVLKPLKDIDASRFKRGLPWSGVDAGALAVRSAWTGHTLGALALGQDESGGALSSAVETTGFFHPDSAEAQQQQPPEPVPGRQPYRPRPELWHPAYQRRHAAQAVAPATNGHEVASVTASLTGRKGPRFTRRMVEEAAQTARPLSDVQIGDLLREVASGPGRADPMFQRWRPSLMTVDGGSFPIPFLVYDGDTTVIHGRVHDISYLRAWTDGTGYQPVYSVERNKEIGFAELWLVNYADTIGGVYFEVVLNFVVTRTLRGPYRWRSPYSSLVPMMDGANRLFTPRLVLDVKREVGSGPIAYGNALFGMDKKPGRIDSTRDGHIRHVSCWDDGDQCVGEPALKVQIDESPSAALDIESGIELGREIGMFELLKNARQIRQGIELKGGMISPDFRMGRDPTRRFGRKETVDIQARYKFNPRLIPLEAGDVRIGRPGRLSADGADNLAKLITDMGFEAQIAAVDEHLKSVLLLDGWPTPEGAPAPDRPPSLGFPGVLGM